MFRRIAKFEKVSFDQFFRDWTDTFYEDKLKTDSDIYGEGWNEERLFIRDIYNSIKLPTRATKGSAGYDFYSPIKFALSPNNTIKIPTGIRCKMKNNYGLFLIPRSGLGFKFREQLDNTIGLVDADYYGSDNEGHIFAKITNGSLQDKILAVYEGDGFMQGVFLQFGITSNDKVKRKRNGGFGSTSK